MLIFFRVGNAYIRKIETEALIGHFEWGLVDHVAGANHTAPT